MAYERAKNATNKGFTGISHCLASEFVEVFALRAATELTGLHGGQDPTTLIELKERDRGSIDSGAKLPAASHTRAEMRD